MKVTVLFDTFPSLSETFLYNTVHSWQRAGVELNLLSRKRGTTIQDIPFLSEVKYLPSESLVLPVRVLILFWLILRLLSSPQKISLAWRCVSKYGNGIREKFQQAYRIIPLILNQTEIMYFPFGGMAVKYLEYIRETNAQVIFSLRGSDINVEPLRSERYRDRMMEALVHARAVHCVCHAIESKARSLSASVNLHVIHTALGREFLHSKNTPNEDVGEVLEIVSVGRLDWKRGLEHGIVAARELSLRGVNFRWQIIGDGNYRLPLQWAIRDMGMEDQIFLAGPLNQKDVAQALQNADVFFHPSITDGISNAVLEAMSLGLPVVACDVGGMREAVPSDDHGLLVPARHWKQMADRLEQLSKDRKLRERVGSAARTFVREKFSTELQTAKFLTLFDQVVDQAVS